MNETDRTEADEFLSWIDNTPEFRAAYAQAQARADRQVDRPCPFGNCTTWIDPLDRTVCGGIGPVGCGCDSLAGWRAKHYDGLPKPGWNVKAVGRHGGKIAASRRKHAAHACWLTELAAVISSD